MVEYLLLFLTLAHFHDGDVIASLPPVVRTVLSLSPALVGVLIASTCSAFLFWDETIKRRLEENIRNSGPLSLGVIAFHLVAFLALFGLSAAMLSWANQQSMALILFVAWLISAIACTVTLFRAAFGRATWSTLVALGRPLASALVAGSVASGLAILAFQFWTILTIPTLSISAFFLRAFFDVVIVDRANSGLALPDFGVIVDASCSGIEGLALVSLFILLYLYKYRENFRLPRALILWSIGVAISFLGNAIRISTLVVVGEKIDPELAIGAFHSMAGWVFFCVITVTLLTVAERIPWLLSPTARNQRTGQSKPKSGMTPETLYLLPFVTWLGTGLATASLTNNSDSLYPLRVIVIAGLGAVMLRAAHASRLVQQRPIRSALGFASALPPLSIGAAVFATWLAMSPTSNSLIANPVSFTSGWFLLWSMGRLLGHVFIVPLIEEGAFRGYLQRRLISPDFSAVPQGRFTPVSLLGSSVCFGLLHDGWVVGILAGVAFSFATYLRGRLLDAVIAHAFANFMIAIWAFGYGRWDLL
ncbi:exosortase E/protease, VPEID-CTERM system (plasmid) [Salipiger sp. H15]|uniref:Exosortase E/protease, VPEID-CTERM system n=1 Tax=Alloyangia sp. H15 TaxID=3029062 RepID=A0AAU8AT22_9RHOB